MFVKSEIIQKYLLLMMVTRDVNLYWSHDSITFQLSTIRMHNDSQCIMMHLRRSVSFKAIRLPF